MVCFQGKPFNITVIQVYAPTTNAKEAKSWMVLWWPTRPSRTNTQKRCPFHHRGLKCKSKKSRDTWSNRQIWLGGQNEAGQKLIDFCQENALVIANTFFQQHKRWLYTWTLQMANTKIRLIIFFSSIKEFKYIGHIPWGRIRNLPWISPIFSWLLIPCLSTSALPPINICLNPCFKTQIVKKCGPQKGFHHQDPCRVLLSFMMRTRKYSFNSINSVVSLTRAVSLQQWKQTPPWII